MQRSQLHCAAAVITLGLLSACATPDSHTMAESSGPVCEGYGPQTPRDIDNPTGTNPIKVPVAPAYQALNLCNMHFHKNAEHKAKDFSIYAGTGDAGAVGGGYMCQMSKTLSAAEMAPTREAICEGLKPGDTIEIHWVYSSCAVKPGVTLGACLTPVCTNPELRVETQVFTLVNDSKAAKLTDYSYSGKVVNGFHQTDALPTGTGTPVQFAGSTTGPTYSDQKCSATSATWNVRPQCAKLDIHSVGQWCKGNVFKEVRADGVRKLVVNPKLLAPMR